MSRSVKRRWYDFCLRYRMNPNNIYTEEFYPEEEDLDYCIRRGFNAMVMTTPPLRRATRNNADNLQLWVKCDLQPQLPADSRRLHGEP